MVLFEKVLCDPLLEGVKQQCHHHHHHHHHHHWRKIPCGLGLIPLQGCRLVDLIWIRAAPLLVVPIALFNKEQTVPKITQVLCRSSPGFLGQRPVGDVPWCAHFWLIKIHLKIFLSLTLQDSSMAMGHYSWFLIDARISWLESRC